MKKFAMSTCIFCNRRQSPARSQTIVLPPEDYSIIGNSKDYLGRRAIGLKTAPMVIACMPLLLCRLANP